MHKIKELLLPASALGYNNLNEAVTSSTSLRDVTNQNNSKVFWTTVNISHYFKMLQQKYFITKIIKILLLII